MTRRAELKLVLGPFTIATRSGYIAWGDWAIWVTPFRPYRSPLAWCHFGPGHDNSIHYIGKKWKP